MRKSKEMTETNAQPLTTVLESLGIANAKVRKALELLERLVNPPSPQESLRDDCTVDLALRTLHSYLDRIQTLSEYVVREGQ